MSLESGNSGNNEAKEPCPGSRMAFTFDALTPNQTYTITLDSGLSFTGYLSGTGSIPGGMTLAGNKATFTAPADSVSFALGVVVSENEVALSTDLTDAEKVSVSLLSGSVNGYGGSLKFKPLESDLPPTCVVLNPAGPACPVCHMNTSQCPEAAAIRESKFCMGQHIFLCCLECPGEIENLLPE